MKTLKNLALFLLFSVIVTTFTNCGDDNDPTPTQSNLDKVKASMVGTWTFSKALVSDGIDPIQTITNGCITGKYDLSVDNFDLIFLNDKEVRFKSNCGNFDYIKYYKITELSNDFNFIIYNNQNNTGIYVNSLIKYNDIINSNGSLKNEIKVKFNEITVPSINWKFSPEIYFVLK